MKQWIAIFAIAMLVLSGCDSKTANTAGEKTQNAIKEAADATKEAAKSATQATKEAVKDAVQATKEVVQEKVVEPTKEVVNNAVDATKEATKDAVETTKEVAKDAQEAVQEKVVEPTKKVINDAKEKTTASAGKALFTPCISCHGTKAQKEALGKSQVIAGWDKEKIIAALKGYKDGSYGGAMKGVMKGQATKLTDEQITQLAEYISSL